MSGGRSGRTGRSMRARVGISFLLVLVAAGVPSCGGAPLAPPPPGTDPAVIDFSSERAWRHLEALVEIGPRVPGSEESAKARAYILDELSKLDLKVETHTATVPLPPDGREGLRVVNLVAVIPGSSSPDLVILATPYDTRSVRDPDYVGANDGASGAAVLLELARVIAEKPLPYTTWAVFLDGEAPVATKDPLRPAIGLLGSSAFAASLTSHGLMPRVRLVTVFARVGDADLRIARDLQSHRMYREEFFRAAEVTGHTEAFRSDQPFESPYASQRSFVAYGLRRVVVLSDTSFGDRDESGELRDELEDTLEHCSPESLGAVGAVTLVALDRITARLEKIDRFSDYPLASADEALAVPVGTLPPEREEDPAPGPSEPVDSVPAEPLAEASAGSGDGGSSATATEAPATAPDRGAPQRPSQLKQRAPTGGLGASDL